MGVFLGLIGIIIVVALGTIALSSVEESFFDTLINDATNSATNAAIDATGLKSQLENTLYENVDNIAALTGLSTSEATSAIESLDIESWTATTLPSDATETGTVSGEYEGIEGTITTYDSSEYVTVETLGQKITLAVPESAQEYLPLLSYL